MEYRTADLGHGLALWLNQPGGQGEVGVAAQRSELEDKAGWIYRDGCPDLFAALGAGKWRMYVIPSLKLVALRQGDSDRDRFEDNALLSLLLAGKAFDDSVRDVDMPDNKRQAVQLFLQRFDRNGDGKIVPDEAGHDSRTRLISSTRIATAHSMRQNCSCFSVDRMVVDKSPMRVGQTYGSRVDERWLAIPQIEPCTESFQPAKA